ncbi:MAG: SPOR domain-containing protein [Alphaproteobacteria bacterium]
MQGAPQIVVCALALLVAFASPSMPVLAAPTFEDGIAAFQRGDYDAAVNAWAPLAAQGNASALFNLGQMHRRGLGVPADQAAAERYYRQAALLGHVSAQANLGSLYFTKDPRQPKEAMYFWRQAARQGDAVSQYQIGVQYFNGEIVVRDQVEGYAWMVLAADSGLADGKRALDQMRGFLSTEQLQQGAELALELQKDIGAAQAGRIIRTVPLAPSQAAQASQTVPPEPAASTTAPRPVAVAAAPQTVSKVSTAPAPKTPPPPTPSPPRPEPVVDPEPAAEPEPAVVSIPVEVVPSPQPVAVPQPAPQSSEPSPPPAVVTSPQDIEGDRWRVQIAARRSKDDAQAALDKVTARHAGLLATATPIVYRADLGARGIFYRAQLGYFSQRGEAAGLCNALTAAGAECFVTGSPAR